MSRCHFDITMETYIFVKLVSDYLKIKDCELEIRIQPIQMKRINIKFIWLIE